MAGQFDSTIDSNAGENYFLCGVVEGFYGRPWTTEQRKDLFQKLKKWGMDSYVYAPKDDYKHRAYWRELYTVEEAEHLTGLISAAKAQGIVFYYALSPGLDISYSSQKEIATLKRKLEQVAQFGCMAFALLFDDIEPEMSEADKEIFQSFAHAQVSVTNDVWRHLGCPPRFLLCPTQYCGSRANPNVCTSDYLNTLGSKLDPHINIMWTGQKVISKTITADCIEEITRVLRRPPVIWDNLHANDYDQKRVFLGPYCGRTPALIPLLRGVLTNPNCEYNANCVPIHTLAQWAKCTVQSEDIDAAAGVDGRLEREASEMDGHGMSESNEDHQGDDDENPEEEVLTGAGNAQVYNHQQALRNAVKEWLPEFFVPKNSFGPITKPQPIINVPPAPIIPILPSVNTCMSLTSSTSTVTTPSVQSTSSSSTSTISSTVPSIPTINTSQLHALADVCSQVSDAEKAAGVVPNAFTPVMNSLVSETMVVTDDAIPNPIPPIVSSTVTQHLPASVPVSAVLGGPVATSALVNSQEGANCQGNKTRHDLDGVQLNGNISSDDHDDDEIKVDCDGTKAIDSIKNGIINVTDVDKESESTSVSALLNDNTHDSDVTMSDGTGETSSTMQVEPAGSPDNQDMIVESPVNLDGSDGDDSRMDLSEDDLMLLCELFYLPFAHGKKGLKLLNSFHWLHTRATLLLPPTREINNQECLSRWRRRCHTFLYQCAAVTRLARRLVLAPNRELSSDLISYVLELRQVTTLLATHIRWLVLGKFPHNISTYTQCSYTWFSVGWRMAFEAGTQEPWVFRGGLQAELRRLLPPPAAPPSPVPPPACLTQTRLYTARPYSHKDHQMVCEICNKTCRDGSDCFSLFPEHLRCLPADRLVDPFLTLCPEFCMVVEDETDCLYPEGSWPRSHNKDYFEGESNSELIGYACGALDCRQFYRKQEVAWVPEMCEKYPLSLLEKGEELSQAAKESIQNFHNFKYSVPDTIYAQYPSIVCCAMLPDCRDPTMARRLMTCLMASLRANGSGGVHVCINPTDHYMAGVYQRLGFVELSQGPDSAAATRLYLGRSF